jgi:hypothetical protein
MKNIINFVGIMSVVTLSYYSPAQAQSGANGNGSNGTATPSHNWVEHPNANPGRADNGRVPSSGTVNGTSTNTP